MEEPGRRPFAGVDLRRPKGYAAASTTPAEAEVHGDPCPRCESRDTKFCYYNNYNTSQPRHYCRSCRRYWTKGGSLRNVPVGGGSRKTSSSSLAAASPKRAKNSKRRRVAPAAPEAEHGATTDDTGAAQTEPAASGTVDDPATALDAARTEGTANGTVGDAATDDPGAPPAVDDGGFADPWVALGVGVADASGKEPSDTSPFEWQSGCNLGSYWAPGVFADTDPALFLNLP